MSQARLQVDADGVLQLAGELDFVSAPLLREQLLAAVESGQGPLVLDFAQVTQANSVALSLLLRVAEQASRSARELQVRALPAGVQSMARVCDLEDWLQQHTQAPT
ncbi:MULTISPECIES: STAS domain-containing protein [Pseudomonas]|uniref:Anti-anti-sigma factor n=1 Tax=Pseudomonas abyssi TaxID=170540 RepID=A0A2A3MMQ3_9PSED|nr:STAS domain-containing protein [Pseudomonas abyssi]MAD00501.1 anti-sigma factor antagonist [Pseudomonadales bacterium]MAG65126.1 anti-sigma factor antagonist [Pseudomonadales bacterium]PBK06081.1 anti-anti-sigma factor [Pseudomonas abyssi]